MMLLNVTMRTIKSTLQVCAHELDDARMFVGQPPVSSLEFSSPLLLYYHKVQNNCPSMTKEQCSAVCINNNPRSEIGTLLSHLQSWSKWSKCSQITCCFQWGNPTFMLSYLKVIKHVHSRMFLSSFHKPLLCCVQYSRLVHSTASAG